MDLTDKSRGTFIMDFRSSNAPKMKGIDYFGRRKYTFCINETEAIALWDQTAKCVHVNNGFRFETKLSGGINYAQPEPLLLCPS